MQVYADNAATTRMHQTAIDTMTYHLNHTFGNPSSLYTIGQEAKEVLETARADMAACFGAQPREIYFTSGGSEADNQAITSAAYIGARKGKKHIISTTFEHHAVLHTLKRLEKHHVRQQRVRHLPAHPGVRRGLHGIGRSVPHRRRPGGRPREDRRQ